MTTTDQRTAPVLPTPTSSAPIDLAAPSTPQRMVESVARCAVEIVRDMRPVSTLSRIVTPEIASMLARRAALTQRLRATTDWTPPTRIVVTGVRTCVVNDRTVEASCVLREPDRSRFLAMRWELRHTGWRVTVLEIG